MEKIGLYFYINEEVIMEAVSVEMGIKYGDMITSKQSHFNVWEELYLKKYQHEYDYFPRGRVVYSPVNNQYILYIDKCIDKAGLEQIKHITCVMYAMEIIWSDLRIKCYFEGRLMKKLVICFVLVLMLVGCISSNEKEVQVEKETNDLSELEAIGEVEVDENYTEFKVFTTNEKIDMAESFSVMAFYMYGGMYNIFSEIEIDNINIEFINEASGEVISEANSKDIYRVT